MIWYSSGKFDSMLVIIYESSMCMSGFCVSPPSILILVIHNLEYIVTSSIIHVANFLQSVVLKAPVVGSNFLESFIQASIVYPYLSSFSIGISAI